MREASVGSIRAAVCNASSREVLVNFNPVHQLAYINVSSHWPVASACLRHTCAATWTTMCIPLGIIEKQHGG